MLLYGYLDPNTGFLSNIGVRDAQPNDVILLATPSGLGPWTYDSVNQLAVQGTPTISRLFALAFADNDEALPLLLRAVLLVELDAINTLRQWTVSFQAAVAAATSLTDLKTRVAALTTLNDITAATAKAAVKTKITSGGAD